MNTSPQTTKLNEAVVEFQSRLDADVETDDPQQLHRWTGELRTAFDQLETIVAEQRQRIHDKLFREIGEQDATQQDHIRELQQADSEVENLLEIVKAQLIELSVRSGSDVEARIENQGSDEIDILDVTERGMELIHWIRMQEETVTAWFAEAFANGATTDQRV